MNVEDIDFEEHTIRIRGKGDKIRIVFIDDETLSDVRTFIGNQLRAPFSSVNRVSIFLRGRFSIYSSIMPPRV